MPRRKLCTLKARGAGRWRGRTVTRCPAGPCLLILALAACTTRSPAAVASRQPPATASLCPAQAPQDPGPDPAAGATLAAKAAIAQRYPAPAYNTAGFQVSAAYPASVTGTGYAPIPFGMCGPVLGRDTWVVELTFPMMAKQGPDLSHGQLFLARFSGGWKVWFQYH